MELCVVYGMSERPNVAVTGSGVSERDGSAFSVILSALLRPHSFKETAKDSLRSSFVDRPNHFKMGQKVRL